MFEADHSIGSVVDSNIRDCVLDGLSVCLKGVSTCLIAMKHVWISLWRGADACYKYLIYSAVWPMSEPDIRYTAFKSTETRKERFIR